VRFQALRLFWSQVTGATRRDEPCSGRRAPLLCLHGLTIFLFGLSSQDRRPPAALVQAMFQLGEIFFRTLVLLRATLECWAGSSNYVVQRRLFPFSPPARTVSDEEELQTVLPVLDLFFFSPLKNPLGHLLRPTFPGHPLARGNPPPIVLSP